ncbi:lipoprotein [Candidatus Magnetobacterium bavaricum]|uniref:Lipoprotein n=1 Tax=Candidatus Magnetobacterium bavaricum TaxID=29290 RepID=A0A0F3GNU3_9BACT|nr:lipoprotein [Candidatus Magnetobacterium bavaricum]
MLARYLIVLCLFMLYGCGYTVVNRGSLAFDTVRIGSITNVTVEPKLQDMLYEALTEHLMRRGVTVSDSADNVLEGKINYFNAYSLSEKKGYASDYEVIIKGDFTLKRDGKDVRTLKGVTSAFSETFESAQRLNKLVANKQSADVRAIDSLALRIVMELLY